MILGMALINLVIRWPVYLFANHSAFRRSSSGRWPSCRSRC
jgi:hypothetical protein